MPIKTNPKQLLLIDGIGALVSALFLGVILVQFQSLIGLPKAILYGLALAPCFFMIYDFVCYFFLKSNWKPYLKFIAICNMVYCCITAYLLYSDYEVLSSLGILYFVLELLILIVLVRVEWRSAATTN